MKEHLSEAVALAMQIRNDGGNVELVGMDSSHTREDYEAYAKRNHREKVTFLD